ncbi:MAG TPA: preprotein translocase subunit SecY [Firmicutes bacterium]|nr:preprotein translocase subunit SecY [Bacillota bacterium]
MFKRLRGFFGPTNKDLRHRILFTIFALAIFSIGTNIVVPGAKTITKDLGFLELLNVMTGGGLKNFSIFALGVMPYITASIITQILQMDIVPYFSELKEEGASGRQKINKINRYLGIIFALLQGYIFSYAFLKGYGSLTVLKSALVLTGGTAFLLWLGDEITKKGIGNGQSLIIMAGIVQGIPSVFISAYNSFITSGSYALWIGIGAFILFTIVYLAIIVGVIWIQEAERRIPVQYSNRTASSYRGEKTYLPIKLNSASVMPVIFASAIVGIPSLIAEFLNKEGFTKFVENYISYYSWTGLILYIVLIYAFGYIYTKMIMNSEEMAENLDKAHAYIPGITPGEATSKYLKNSISRLTVVGSIFLIILAIMPLIFTKLSGLGSAVTIGGTGLLIVCGVCLETYKQLESSIVSRNYTTVARRRR